MIEFVSLSNQSVYHLPFLACRFADNNRGATQESQYCQSFHL